MEDKIQIGTQELLVLLEFEDSKYKKITMCLDEDDNRVFIINDKLVTDKNIIDYINKKYELEVPDEMKGIVF